MAEYDFDEVKLQLQELGYAPDEIADIVKAIEAAAVASDYEIPNNAAFLITQIIDRLYTYAANDK